MGDGGRTELRKPLPDDASMLEYAWSLARGWSDVATAIKTTLTRARAATLIFLVGGAIAGAVGATAETDDGTRGWAVVAALSLALAGLLETFVVTPSKTRDWTQARNASERLKAEGWAHVSRVAPYDGPDEERDRSLRLAIDEIDSQVWLDDVRKVELHAVHPPDAGEGGVEALYVKQRAEDQRDWHYDKADIEGTKGQRLRLAVLAMSAGGAVVVSLSSVPSIFGGTPLAAWVATLSAATGAITTHSRAARHDDIARGYERTARELRRVTNRYHHESDRAAAFPGFVRDVERILAIQNDTWTDTVER